jgi:hypothetical protein
MSRGTFVAQTVCVPAIALIVLMITSAVGHSQPVTESSGIESFFRRLPGDWVGTVSQSTDGKAGSPKYFHSVTKQLSPDIYESVFTYYRLDDKTGDPVLVGVSGMATKIDTAGTATNRVTGKGDILVDVNTWKPETHDLTELLRTSPTGGLVGTGGGSISVTGMPLGLGKNGKVQGYTSTWSLSNDVLSISQRFKVGFRVFLFRKSYTVMVDYTANRGSDIIGLMKAAKAARAKAQ